MHTNIDGTDWNSVGQMGRPHFSMSNEKYTHRHLSKY